MNIADAARDLARPAPVVPHRLPFVGSGLDFGRDPDGFMAACRERFGAVFTVALPGAARTILVDPRDFPAYFQCKALDFRRVSHEIGGRVFGYDPHDAERFDFDEMSKMFVRLMKGDELDRLNVEAGRRFGERLDSAYGSAWTTGGPRRASDARAGGTASGRRRSTR
jgi:hypothetical protein